MRTLLYTLLFAAMIGCSSTVVERMAPTELTGKLSDASGKTVGNVLLTLQPLEDGHLAPLQVAADGSFKGEVVPGKYAYYVGKSSAKNAEQALKVVDSKFYEASLERTIDIKSGEPLNLVLQ